MLAAGVDRTALPEVGALTGELARQWGLVYVGLESDVSYEPEESPDPDDDDLPEVEAEIVDDTDVDEVNLSPDAVALTPAGSRRTLGSTGGSTSLARQDPLAVYMRDVQRYRLLTRDEERELAIRYVEEGDLDAARTLVTSNLRLVVKIAYDYRQAYKNLLDLVQEGNIGLMQAVRKYDPYKGVKLSSYAAWWIRAYILRYILNNFRLVKVGTTQAQRKLFFNLKKEKAKLAALGIDPTPELIAERLDVPKKDVISMDRRLSAGEASLDAPVGTGEGRTVARVDLLPSHGSRVDDVLADSELSETLTSKIHEFGELLVDKEKVIFEERLLAEDPKTLQELGVGFGVSRERVRQIEKRLLQKLKNYISEQVGEGVLDVYEA